MRADGRTLGDTRPPPAPLIVVPGSRSALACSVADRAVARTTALRTLRRGKPPHRHRGTAAFTPAALPAPAASLARHHQSLRAWTCIPVPAFVGAAYTTCRSCSLSGGSYPTTTASCDVISTEHAIAAKPLRTDALDATAPRRGSVPPVSSARASASSISAPCSGSVQVRRRTGAERPVELHARPQAMRPEQVLRPMPARRAGRRPAPLAHREPARGR